MGNLKCLLIRCNRSFWLLLSSLCISFSVNAGTEPESGYFRTGTSYPPSSDPVTACGNFSYVNAAGTTSAGEVGVTVVGSNTVRTYAGGSKYGCTTSPGGTNFTFVYSADWCPSAGGYEIHNGRMTCGKCDLGYTWNGTECIQDQQPSCPSAGTKSTEAEGFLATSSISSELHISQTLCNSNAPNGATNCQVSCNDGVVTKSNVTGNSSGACFSFSYTGQPCASGDVAASSVENPQVGVNGNNGSAPNSPSDCPPGTGFAQINNTKTCLPSGSEYTGDQTTKTDTTTKTTQTSVITVNPDGTTTTTTTTNVTNISTGGTIGSETTTSKGGINTDGTNKNSDKNDAGPVPILDTSLPQEGDFVVKTYNVPVFDTTIFNTSYSCPEPITYDVLGKTFTIDFQPICDYAPIVRGIMLLLAAVVSIRMVVSK